MGCKCDRHWGPGYGIECAIMHSIFVGGRK